VSRRICIGLFLLAQRLCGAPFNTHVRIIVAFAVRSPLRNEYIRPPGCVTMTSALEALRGFTAVITPEYVVIE
jgi:hypothetical protein